MSRLLIAEIKKALRHLRLAAKMIDESGDYFILIKEPNDGSLQELSDIIGDLEEVVRLLEER